MPASDQGALVATAAAVTADAGAVAAVVVAAVVDHEPVYRASVKYGFPFVDHDGCQSLR